MMATEAMTAPAIDRAHLSRMTLGNRDLEREVLQLFDRQAELLIERMRRADAPAIGALAHAIKGSAAGIGANEVARAADMAERAAKDQAQNCIEAIDRLAVAVDGARALIADLLKQG